MRLTKLDENTNQYSLVNPDNSLTVADVITLLGQKEDMIDTLIWREQMLLDNVMKLLEITKGEQNELRDKISELKQNSNIT